MYDRDMDDLIIGAGSVGQVLGLHLSDAGRHVGVLVRPAHAAQARSGYQLRRLRRVCGPVHGRFVPDRVIDDITLLHPGDWNAIWLCVSSTGLRGLGLEQLRARAISPTIVLTSQGVHDRAVLENHWPPEQVVLAAPPFFAFPGPPADPGRPDAVTSYWTPPGGAWQVSGTGERASAVAGALRDGRLKVKTTQAHGAAVMLAAANIPLAAQVESAGWSLRAARRDLGAVSLAASEAAGIVAAVHGAKPPPAIARSAAGMRAGLSALSLLAPFDLERYLRHHFTKVGEQTRLMLDDLIGEGAARDLPVTRLRGLRASLADGSP
jgi:Ketopantoate reductase PanE/ApbA